MRLEERFLPIALFLRSNNGSLHRVFTGLGRYHFGVGLNNPGERSLYACVFQVALATVVLDGGFCRFHRRACLSDLSVVIVVVKLSDEITLMNSLIVGHLDIPNDARHLGAEWSYISTDVSVV